MKKLSVRSQRIFGLVAVVGLVTGLLVTASALAMTSADAGVAYAQRRDNKPQAIPRLDDPAEFDATTDSERRSPSTVSEPRGIPNAVSADTNPAPVRSASSAPAPAERLHTLLAGVRAGSNPGRIYEREHGDQAWSRLGQQEFWASLMKFVWHPHGRHLYALVGGVNDSGLIYRSSDWGLTWQDITPSQDPLPKWRDLVVDPDDPNTLFAGHKMGSAGGLYRSKDAGDSWVRIWYVDFPGAPWPYGVDAIGISPVDPDLVFIAIMTNGYTTAQIRRSTDGGDSFPYAFAYHGPDNTHPYPGYFLMDSRDRDIAYFPLGKRIRDGGIKRTTNGGDSWGWAGNASLGDDRTSLVMAQSATDNQVIYKIGLTQQNIWKSTNRGTTWTRIVTGTTSSFSPSWIIASPQSPDLLYVAGTTGSARVYKSTDGGLQWTDFRTGLPGSGYSAQSLLLLETEGPSHYFGICPSVGQCGDPVNTSTGNFAHEWQDLSIPGPGSSLLVQRTYNSQDSYEGPLGTGWSLSYDMRLVVTDTDVVEMKVEDGRRDRYISGDGEDFFSPPGVNATFVRNTDETYTLTRQDQMRHNFSEEGLLTAIVTSNELTTTLAYDGNRLTNVTDPTGRTVTFTWNVTNTRITGVEDPVARTIDYGYQDGDLTSVTDLRGYAATYAYTGTNGELSSFTDPGQSTPRVVNEYDAQGRVTSQWQAGSTQPMTFSYDPDNTQTTVTDAGGHHVDRYLTAAALNRVAVHIASGVSLRRQRERT